MIPIEAARNLFLSVKKNSESQQMVVFNSFVGLDCGIFKKSIIFVVDAIKSWANGKNEKFIQTILYDLSQKYIYSEIDQFILTPPLMFTSDAAEKLVGNIASTKLNSTSGVSKNLRTFEGLLIKFSLFAGFLDKSLAHYKLASRAMKIVLEKVCEVLSNLFILSESEMKGLKNLSSFAESVAVFVSKMPNMFMIHSDERKAQSVKCAQDLWL